MFMNREVPLLGGGGGGQGGGQGGQQVRLGHQLGLLAAHALE